jgi:hypothetical protein
LQATSKKLQATSKNYRQRHNKSHHIKKIALSKLEATIAHFCAQRPFRWASMKDAFHQEKSLFLEAAGNINFTEKKSST